MGSRPLETSEESGYILPTSVFCYLFSGENPMSAKKRVVRSFSDLASHPAAIPQAAVEPTVENEVSQEDSSGGFVVGNVLSEDSNDTSEVIVVETSSPNATFTVEFPDLESQVEEETPEEITEDDEDNEESIDPEVIEEGEETEDDYEEDVASIEIDDVDSELDDEVIEVDDEVDETEDIEEAEEEPVISEAAQDFADLIGQGASSDEETEVPEVTIIAGDDTITINEGEIEVVGNDGELKDDSEREAVIAEIQQYLPPGRLVNNDVFKNMSVEDLNNHLKMLSLNNGGSPAASKILKEIEEEYKVLIDSPDTKRRLALLEQRGSDFHKMAQKISKILGNEVAVKGMRYQEYHELLQHLTRSSTVIFKEIAAAADYMGIKMPIDELVPSMGSIPIMEGMVIDEKTAMYVLRVLLRQVEHWHHACLLLQQNFDDDSKEKTTLKDRLEYVSKQLKEEVETRDSMLQNIRQSFIEMPEFYIYVTGGGFLALKDEDEKLEVKNLTFTSDIREALFLNSKKAAERIIEVISEKSRFTDYNFRIRRLAAIEV